jgi:hypothetical protein
MLEDEIICEIKPLINSGNLEGMQILWEDYQDGVEFERPIAWDYVFQKVYLHAALKKQAAICQWLDSLYLTFNEMTQIAIRQMFPYARYLLRK